MHSDASNAPRPSSGAWIWLILAVVAAAGFLYISTFGVPGRSANGNLTTALGKRLPYLRIDPLLGDAKSVSLSDFEGRVTVVNYWGTWCGPCIQEIPHMVELGEEFKSNLSFRLYLVSCGQGEDRSPYMLRDETMKFVAARGIDLPIYVDQNFASRKSMIAALGLEGMGYPTTLVFDRKAIIRGAWLGYSPGDERQLRALVKQLLAEAKG